MPNNELLNCDLGNIKYNVKVFDLSKNADELEEVYNNANVEIKVRHDYIFEEKAFVHLEWITFDIIRKSIWQ
jgi:hypothetical protein